MSAMEIPEQPNYKSVEHVTANDVLPGTTLQFHGKNLGIKFECLSPVIDGKITGMLIETGHNHYDTSPSAILDLTQFDRDDLGNDIDFILNERGRSNVRTYGYDHAEVSFDPRTVSSIVDSQIDRAAIDPTQENDVWMSLQSMAREFLVRAWEERDRVQQKKYIDAVNTIITKTPEMWTVI